MGIGRTETDSLKVHDFLGFVEVLVEEGVDLVLEKEVGDADGVDPGVVLLLLGMTDIGEDEGRNQERLFDFGVDDVVVNGFCSLP